MELITRTELREKLEQRADDFKLVMTLSTWAYEAKRIPTSLHFETIDEALDALDPADEIVVYCGDAHCAASIYAYRFLERAGYSRVRRYAGGISDWEDAGYSLEQGPVKTSRPPERRSKRTRKVARRSWALCAQPV